MAIKKYPKNRLVRAFLGCIFGILGMFAALNTAVLTSTPVYAEEQPVETTEVTGGSEVSEGGEGSENSETSEGSEEKQGVAEMMEAEATTESKSCRESLGAIGWLVCPTTGKISEAVDWLYDKIENILVINPVAMEDGSPIYEVWKYARSITNIVFIIFLLIMVYSQITGVGITNYGLKKTLPKLIIAAIVVNLSFVICSLAVDASNLIGNSLRGVFTTIEETTLANMNVSETAHVSMSEMFTSLAGGTSLAVGAGVIMFETGAIWMLIPTALGALAAVVIGLITIALRQAVVALLIMIAPLAMVAYILPNTEKWFQSWKQLLIRMLVFYPMFSLLFGASSLAGFAIIMSAKDGFMVLLGIAVQIFPLFFSWKLMSMSGTFLSTINAKLQSLAARPLGINQKWAESRRELARQSALASNRVYTPSLRLMQFLNDRKVSREEETAEHAATVKNRGLAYGARRNYKRGNLYGGAPTREGEIAYEEQARNAKYMQEILRHKNNMNKGFGYLAPEGTAQRARLDRLDELTVKSFDRLKMEQARTEKIDYDNAMGYHKRMEDAMNAHFDALHEGQAEYKRHQLAQRTAAQLRYGDASQIMEGEVAGIQYTAAFAAHAYDTQAKTIATKYQKYFELLPPTRDVEYRLGELTTRKDASELMDAIIPGLRVLNMRGDTDLVRAQMQNILRNPEGGIELGTHASQALAGFLMFEVKDSDPWLRRFGKYINLETAHVYNKDIRKKAKVDYEEYVKGYYYDPGDPEDLEHRKFAKKGMKELMEGTSLDGVERTAIDNYINSVMDAYSDENGKIVDYKGFEKKLSEVNNATAPQLISAMRKTLSGSEALVSMVKDVTGYEKHQKEDGSYELRSIFDDPKIQKRFGDNLDDYKKYRKAWAKTYLKGLLPSQVLSMRTDELQAFDKLLPGWFGEEHEDLHEALEKQLVETHGDWPEEERASLLKAIESREMFRECLDMGVLEQISRTNTRRGVLDSKPMLRGFLGLDGDNGSGAGGLSKYITDKKKRSASTKAEPEDKEVERIIKELEEIQRQRKEAQSNSDATQPVVRQGLFNEKDVRGFLDVIDETYRKFAKDNDVAGFFKDTQDFVKKNVDVVLEAYTKYHDDHSDATMDELVERLTELLNGLLD